MNQSSPPASDVSPPSWRARLSAQLSNKFMPAKYALIFALGVFLAWFMWGGNASSTVGNDAPPVAAAGGPTLWTCSMHPQIRSSKPGKCPICAMDLIPVSKTSGGMRTLSVSPEAKALMNIENSPVERRYVKHSIPMVGKVDYDETKLGYITAWVAGRLDELHVDFTGVEVQKGYHMVSIYSEELYASQEELIQALKYAKQRGESKSRFGLGDINLVASAREKLRLLGLTEEQIADIEAQNKPSDHITLNSPVAGVVIEKLRQEGERVKLGDRIYTIADLNQVWVNLDAYESDLPWIRYGQDVIITTEAFPGEELHGRIAFIQPVLNDKTRTVKVRVNVPNLEGRLKPEMFVHATVHPTVAAGGRVLDENLAGKWISPMHPEIVKDEPGNCDVCGMPLVRAESLGYVSPDTDSLRPPLVIPYLAALVTGTRAVVYVELPDMPTSADAAFQTLSAVVQEGKLKKTQEAFATYARMLDTPYDHPGTNYAKQLWNKYADRLSQHALAGQRARSAKQAEQHFAHIETVMNEAREQFAPVGQPTFEGREIVLGARAGDYYLVRNGLQAGELVVTQGNFKLDSEIQIQAKPSMMTPDGGGGGSGPQVILPADFYAQIRDLEAAYEGVVQATDNGSLSEANAAFAQYRQTLGAVDVSLLEGRPRIHWKEFRMLLDNDAVEGGDASLLADADRVFLLLKSHMRRMREQMGVMEEPEQQIDRIAVGPAFQAELAKLWRAYLPIQQALASDDFGQARQSLVTFEPLPATVDAESLDDRAQKIWKKENTNLTKLVASMQASGDLKKMRTAFTPFAEEMSVLAKTFGFGKEMSVFELHCPMAAQGKGATWLQDDDETRNPYFGTTMLQCADRVERVVHEDLEQTPDHGAGEKNPHEGHSHN